MRKYLVGTPKGCTFALAFEGQPLGAAAEETAAEEKTKKSLKKFGGMKFSP